MQFPSLDSVRWQIAQSLTTTMTGMGINPYALDIRLVIDAGKLTITVADHAGGVGTLTTRAFPAGDLHPAFLPRLTDAFRMAIATETNRARAEMGCPPFKLAS